MRAVAFLALTVLGLGFTPTSQAAPEGRDATMSSVQRQALASFSAENPDSRLYWAGQRITRVYGASFGGGSTPAEAAERFRLDHAPALGVDPDDLRAFDALGDRPYQLPLMFQKETGRFKFILLTYGQYAGEVPVFRGELRLLVRNEAGNPLVWAGPSLRPTGDFAPDAEDARGFDPAVRTRTGMTSFSAPQVVVWAGLEDDVVDPVLAVTFVGERGAYATGDYEKVLFVADAATGNILYRESQIHHADVPGTVVGMATTGPKADFCAPEAPTPMAFAEVSSIVNGNPIDNAVTDELGNFLLDHNGAPQVDVRSPMTGMYFFVNDFVTTEETVTVPHVPPGPTQVGHNVANTSEYIRAQVNGYIQANVVREFTLDYSPAYPVISTQTDFPVNVDRADGFCPGNAWYDGGSINFCRSGGQYPNTAWSSIVYHEYGHHMVATGGSGQDQYGEGMSDVVSLLILDDPNTGWGFFGNCNQPLRTADNNYQYPCNGEAHDCGNLISGAVWSTREELVITEPTDYLTILSAIAVNAIPMHDGSNISPTITIDYLTLDDDDADIQNGTPHYAEIATGFGAHNLDAPQLAALLFDFPTGRPDVLEPGLSATVRVEVDALAALPQPGTGMLYTSLNGGAWTSEPMTVIADNVYDANLPGSACGTTIDWFVSSETTTGVEVAYPYDAPTQVFSTVVSSNTSLVVNDDFETDLGWAVSNQGLSAGAWARGVPQGAGDRGDPLTDYDGSGQCYLTGNYAGDSDVDGGPTTLTSARFDLAGQDAVVSYATWFYNDDRDDSLIVQLSNDDGGTWTTVETRTSGVDGSWKVTTFDVADYLPATANMRLRFQVSDNPNNSVTEAGVDAVKVTATSCDAQDVDIDLSVIALTPQPKVGTTASFEATVTNNGTLDQPVTGWLTLALPDGTVILDPLQGPKDTVLGAGETRVYTLQSYIRPNSRPQDYRLWVRVGDTFPGPLYAEAYTDFTVVP